MALIKCSECSKEISDKAITCPFCGNPINNVPAQVKNNPTQPLKIEPELTSKRWKIVKIVAWIVMIVGIIVMMPGGNASLGLGFIIAAIGLIALIVAYIGAWYADKRTR
ncbi:zinc-ribbon domain-containing protein [Patescibacteria group bacterium]|nr:zinc-ribbon domain-containing protein [Patescibacteria group bacterium]